MRCQIDAWLERKDPLIRVIDADTGWEIMHLDAEQVNALMESGDICPSDLEDDVISRKVLASLIVEQAA